MNEYNMLSIIIVCLIIGVIIGFIIREILVDDRRIAGRIIVYTDDQNKNTKVGFKLTNPEKLTNKYVIFEVFEICNEIEFSQENPHV